MPASRREGFVVDRVAIEHVFIRVFRISPVSTFPPMLHNHLNLHVAFIRIEDKAYETSKKQCSSAKLRALVEKYFEVFNYQRVITHSKMDKRTKDKLVRSPRENGRG